MNASRLLTLHILSSVTNTFLAARSRWTKSFLERYSIPEATCWQNFSSRDGVSEDIISPGLKLINTVIHFNFVSE